MFKGKKRERKFYYYSSLISIALPIVILILEYFVYEDSTILDSGFRTFFITFMWILLVLAIARALHNYRKLKEISNKQEDNK
ncbi:hypothetical protein ACEN4P_05520 [Marinilactibacillus psychrotolerans]|uniref:Uncharacterized protein n=3 Tax=Marinilactibacillus psychrotolerans TaxID=191770 RepID=A0A511H2I0_9LACT|nr:hypothetical protein [Marinilactibacillus psychrotolerans]TLQ06729.1 hypothetical protein FEZ48_08985 [Marinilactibacillus psychrotolerans]SDC69689.1 hypothetical protein SAMN04488013_10846 [Marinilactibacillus psychrotolerans]SJN31759.1 hypothetical protein FM115_05600 [Marinilactibacillus psychrotolerans 42ea]GEL67736.1 hypothetical protein MPS01_18910 [Marinilactibacillus psychrotolerans]GEQ32363.1 hypothetical protein B795N_02450 [Marinilactibacillus psychrotolerans]